MEAKRPAMRRCLRNGLPGVNNAWKALAPLIVLQAALSLLTGCATKQPAQAKELHNPAYIKTMTAEQLSNRIERAQRMKVVNVLSADTYNDCHIRGSINVPLSRIKKQAKKWRRGELVVLYCASYTCPASKHAFNILAQMGFSNIYAYEGGTKEWREKGYPTTGLCKLEYLTN